MNKTIALTLILLSLTCVQTSANLDPMGEQSQRIMSSQMSMNQPMMTSKAKNFQDLFINDTKMAQTPTKSLAKARSTRRHKNPKTVHKMHKDHACHSRWVLNKSFRLFNQKFPEYLVHYNHTKNIAELKNHKQARKHVKEFEWFATYDATHSAYYIHSTQNKGMVWSAGPSHCGADTFKLVHYRRGNRHQLFRKSRHGWIYPLSANVDKDCKNVPRLFQTGNGVSDGVSLGKVHGMTSLVASRASMFWTFQIGKLDTGAGDPHNREIIVIHDSHKKKMLTFDRVPVEERNLTTHNYSLSNQKNNYWWTENVDGFLIIHSYYAPDMVMSCVDASHGAKLRLEKYIPGDRRQQFVRSSNLSSLTCRAKWGEHNHELSVGLVGNHHVLNRNTSHWQFKIKFTIVDVMPSFPVHRIFRVWNYNRSYRAYISGPNSNLTFVHKNNRSWKHMNWWAHPMNNGFVIHWAHDPKWVWERSTNNHIYLREYIPGNPWQIFTRTQSKHGGIAGVSPDKSGLTTMYHKVFYGYSGSITTQNISTHPYQKFHFEEFNELPGMPTDSYFHIRMAMSKGVLRAYNAHHKGGRNQHCTMVVPPKRGEKFSSKVMRDWWAREATAPNGTKGYFVFSRRYPNLALTVEHHSANMRILRLRHFNHNSIIPGKKMTHFNKWQFFNFESSKHLLRLAMPISGHGHNAVHWTMSTHSFSVHSGAVVVFVRRSTQSGGLHEKVTRRLTDTSFDSTSRNRSCPMCGVYQLEDWRDDLWGENQNYPQRYLRIETPQDQIMVHFPNTHKVCNVNSSSYSYPCTSNYNSHHVRGSHWRTRPGKIGQDVRWSNFNSSFMKPERVSFWDNTVWMKKTPTAALRKYERVRQTYHFATSIRTPNVGIYWVKIDFGKQRIDRPDGTTVQGDRKPPAQCLKPPPSGRSGRDILMIFDGSGSVGQANFHNMLKAGATLAADILANGKNKVGAMIFPAGYHASPITSSYSTVKNWLDSRKFPSGGTPTQVAFQRGAAWINRYVAKNGKIDKHIVIFTDGAPNNAPAALAAANSLKGQGFRITSITITSSQSLVSQANKWASTPKGNNTYHIKNFQPLMTELGRSQFATAISSKVCRGP